MLFKRVLCCVLISLLINAKIMANQFDLPAAAYLIINLDSGEVISALNADVPLPMASTTKIMTCILALEHLNLSQIVTIDPEWVKVEGSSLGLLGGHTISVYDLLVGMMLRSGNDAANCVAYLVGGSINNFCEMMDRKAVELKMYSTNFETPSGLPNTKHRSTAGDMAKLASYALKNESFLKICSQSSATITVSQEQWHIKNTNKLLDMVEGTVGVKTGYTDAAGRCLISAVFRPEGKYLCVTFNMGDHFTYHSSVYNILYEKMTDKQVPLNAKQYQIKVVGGNTDVIRAVTADTGLLYSDEPILVKEWLPSFVYAPIKKGQILGRAEYKIGESESVVSVQITATEDVDVKETKTWYQKIINFLKH